MDEKVKFYSCWIVVPDSLIKDEISGIMLDLTFCIRSLSSSGKICSDETLDMGSYTLGWLIRCEAPIALDVLNLLKEEFSKRNINFYSLIVAEFSANATWQSGSLKAPAAIEFTFPPQENKKDLK